MRKLLLAKQRSSWACKEFLLLIFISQGWQRVASFNVFSQKRFANVPGAHTLHKNVGQVKLESFCISHPWQFDTHTQTWTPLWRLATSWLSWLRWDSKKFWTCEESFHPSANLTNIFISMLIIQSIGQRPRELWACPHDWLLRQCRLSWVVVWLLTGWVGWLGGWSQPLREENKPGTTHWSCLSWCRAALLNDRPVVSAPD